MWITPITILSSTVTSSAQSIGYSRRFTGLCGWVGPPRIGGVQMTATAILASDGDVGVRSSPQRSCQAPLTPPAMKAVPVDFHGNLQCSTRSRPGALPHPSPWPDPCFPTSSCPPPPMTYPRPGTPVPTSVAVEIFGTLVAHVQAGTQCQSPATRPIGLPGAA